MCTLICAPAGYGKTTLACQWLCAIKTPSAWFSIDKSDNDLRRFLSYTIAAIHSTYPDTCNATADLLNAAGLRSPAELAETFSLDFERIGQPLILVLEDYHQVSSNEIHEFLNPLLRRPPHGFHLVIITRRDPPLALQLLRANGTLREIRGQQLSLNRQDADAFLRRALCGNVSDAAALALRARTEGWPAAMRLAVLAVPAGQSPDALIERIPSDTHLLRSYFMQEVLNNCSDIERQLLLKTSLLDRFCACLCREVLDSPGDSAWNSRDATSGFMKRIQDGGFFGVPLDGGQQWYRYHSLFQSALRERAAIEMDALEIEAVHEKAAAWFEAEGLLEDAIRHLLEIRRPGHAADVIVRNRNQIMNAEQWIRLLSMLRALPEELLQSRPDLMLLRARLLTTRGGWAESYELLLAAESLLKESSADNELLSELEGSLESLRCFQLYSDSQAAAAVASAKRAYDLLPPDSETERGFAMILLGGAMQMTGQVEEARSAFLREMPSAVSDRPTFTTRLLNGLSFINWIDADLAGLVPVAKRTIEVSEVHGLREIFTIGNSLLGSAEYHWNQLEALVERLEPIVEYEAVFNAEFHAQCMILCATAQQELGRHGRASEIASRLGDLALRSGAVYPVILSNAFNAELALRQGRISEARRWADAFDPEPLRPMYSFLAAPLVQARILVLADTSDSREHALQRVERLVDYTISIHNRHCLAQALALRALLRERIDDIEGACKDLSEAIAIAQPGRYLRMFIDLGPRIRALLTALELDGDALTYVGEILAGLGDGPDELSLTASSAGSATSMKLLSKRELQILQLLARRLSNKEIANLLHISDVTVKRHTANIYQKLGVHGRRHAVAKAAGLGYISGATDRSPS